MMMIYINYKIHVSIYRPMNTADTLLKNEAEGSVNNDDYHTLSDKSQTNNNSLDVQLVSSQGKIQ